MNYPIKIKASRNTIEEWQLCEEGRWEDEGRPCSGHAYNILNRHKTVIEVRDERERDELIDSARMSTLEFRVSWQTVDRIIDQLQNGPAKPKPKKPDNRAAVREAIKQDMPHFRRVAKRWGVSLKSLKVDVQNSNGGWGGIRNGKPWIFLGADHMTYTYFHEYDRIQNLRAIGTRVNITGEQSTRILAAHEIAHAIAHLLIKKGEPARLYDNHNQGWQEIYRECRARVNAELPDDSLPESARAVLCSTPRP